MEINVIYATDPNGVIGIINPDGSLDQPFYSTRDFNWFKSLTLGHTVIMGKNTFKAIGKALPNRTNIVITSTPEVDLGASVITVGSIKEALYLTTKKLEKVFFIGGAEILEQVYAFADNVFITVFDNYAQYEENDGVDQCIRFFPPKRLDLRLGFSEQFRELDSKTGLPLTGEFQHWKSMYPSNLLQIK